MLLQNKNFFQIFSIPEAYDLDPVLLAENYRELQAQVHPDRFANASEAEKLQAVKSTSVLNDAYETLRSPQGRAAHLLQLRDVDVSKVSQSDLSPALLFEQIQLREELEDIPRDEKSLNKLDHMRKQIEEKVRDCQKLFVKNFNTGQLLRAKSNYYEMQYLFKLLSDMDAIEEDLLGY